MSRPVLRRLLRLAAVVGRVEARSPCSARRPDGGRPAAGHPHRPRSRRAGLRHAVEHLEQMTVRALVLVDRHGTGKASSEACRQPGRVASPHVKRAAVAALLALVALALPAGAAAHATLVAITPANGAVLAAGAAGRSRRVRRHDPRRSGQRRRLERDERLGARRAGHGARSRSHGAAALRLAGRRLQRALEHRLGRRPSRART